MLGILSWYFYFYNFTAKDLATKLENSGLNVGIKLETIM